jgi:peptide/nickel transport system permease protein
MRFLLYSARRILVLVPQALGVVTVTFILVRLLPGNPVDLAAGAFATPGHLAQLKQQFGLEKSFIDQYWIFLEQLLHGNLGVSFYTGNSVTSDLSSRFPATLELISCSLVLALLVGVAAGMLLAIRPGGWPDRAAFTYGLFAGALPDFWWGIMLLFVFFVKLHLFPAPLGQLDLTVAPPTGITGMYVVDGLLTGDWAAVSSALAHLALPVFTLAFISCGPIMKMTRQTMEDVLASDYVRYARGMGIKRIVIARRALRNALPPVVNLTGSVYGYLIGGAVLIETVFSWGGMGQYAVQSITNSDYPATQGVVLFASVFSLLVYLLVDLVHLAIDPRLHTDAQ